MKRVNIYLPEEALEYLDDNYTKHGFTNRSEFIRSIVFQFSNSKADKSDWFKHFVVGVEDE